MIIIIVLVLVFWRGCKDVSRGEGSSQGGASNSGCNPIPRDSQNPLLAHNCSCLYPTTRSIPIGWLPTYTSFELPLSGSQDSLIYKLRAQAPLTNVTITDDQPRKLRHSILVENHKKVWWTNQRGWLAPPVHFCICGIVIGSWPFMTT